MLFQIEFSTHSRINFQTRTASFKKALCVAITNLLILKKCPHSKMHGVHQFKAWSSLIMSVKYMSYHYHLPNFTCTTQVTVQYEGGISLTLYQQEE